MAAALSLNTPAVLRHGPKAATRSSSRRSSLQATRRWSSFTTPLRSSWKVAASRADDSSSSPEAPSEMSVESALKVLGVPEGASFDDILRAKNSIVASSKDDLEAVTRAEAAYDMLLMQSFTQRRSGKVANSGVRYADVKPVKDVGTSSLPQWLQSTVNNVPVSVDTPSPSNLGIEAGVYGALMALTYSNGVSMSTAGAMNGADVPGLILATGFGVSLYFLTKKDVPLGKAALITVGGLVIGATVGTVVENWLQVDVIPLFGLRSPAAVVSEFVLLSQFLVSLYLR